MKKKKISKNEGKKFMCKINDIKNIENAHRLLSEHLK